MTEMIPEHRRSKNQPSLPMTSTELEAELAKWKERAEVAEDKLEKLPGKLDAAICSVLGHVEVQYDYGKYCDRCGEDM